MRCQDKSTDCLVTQVYYYPLKSVVRQRDLLRMNSYCAPELTGAGSIRVTITSEGCHATQFWYQGKSGNGEEVWKDFLQSFHIVRFSSK